MYLLSECILQLRVATQLKALSLSGVSNPNIYAGHIMKKNIRVDFEEKTVSVGLKRK